MRKIIIWILILLTASLVGCGAKEKLEEKAGEVIMEKALKDAGVDGEIDGDKVVIEDEEGKELTIGEGEWPSSDLAKGIPEFKDGKITAVMEADDSLFIMIEEISEEDFISYLDEVKKDYTEETFEMNTGTGMMYSAGNNKDIVVTLTYEKDAGFSISVVKVELAED